MVIMLVVIMMIGDEHVGGDHVGGDHDDGDDQVGGEHQSVTFLVSKPKCQSQECDIFGFETGFETKMSFSAWKC